jgi:hypothetical protein
VHISDATLHNSAVSEAYEVEAHQTHEEWDEQTNATELELGIDSTYFIKGEQRAKPKLTKMLGSSYLDEIQGKGPRRLGESKHSSTSRLSRYVGGGGGSTNVKEGAARGFNVMKRMSRAVGAFSHHSRGSMESEGTAARGGSSLDVWSSQSGTPSSSPRSAHRGSATPKARPSTAPKGALAHISHGGVGGGGHSGGRPALLQSQQRSGGGSLKFAKQVASPPTGGSGSKASKDAISKAAAGQNIKMVADDEDEDMFGANAEAEQTGVCHAGGGPVSRKSMACVPRQSMIVPGGGGGMHSTPGRRGSAVPSMTHKRTDSGGGGSVHAEDTAPPPSKPVKTPAAVLSESHPQVRAIFLDSVQDSLRRAAAATSLVLTLFGLCATAGTFEYPDN